MRLFDVFRKEKAVRNYKRGALDIKVKYSSKECVDIEYKGKTARFTGDEAHIGFRAYASSMKWLLPDRNAPVSQKDRDEWISAVNNYYANAKDRVFFVDDNGNELKHI